MSHRKSDQTQLRAIYDWNKNPKQQAPSIVDIILETNNFNYEKTMRWLGYIKDDTLLNLTKQVICRLIKETDREKIWYPLYLLSRQWHLGYDSETNNTYPRICGSIERRNETSELLESWFGEVFKTILTPHKNITLCGEVLYHFGKCHEESRDGHVRFFGLYYWLTEEERTSYKEDESKAKDISEKKVLAVLEKFVEDNTISQEELEQIADTAIEAMRR